MPTSSSDCRNQLSPNDADFFQNAASCADRGNLETVAILSTIALAWPTILLRTPWDAFRINRWLP
jgi:hypothetical protein